MKKITSIFLFLFSISTVFAQLSRYPYIQSTTTNSTIIAWKTPSNTVGQVNYGLDQNNMNLSVAETSATNLHGITLENLTPDTKYFYEILADGVVLTSEFFTTASDSTDQQFSFIHYGDCGYNNAMQNQIGDLMEADDAEFAVVCGDIDQGGVPHVTPGSGGDNYDEIYFNVYNDGVESKMLSRECHYTACGNHDVYADNLQTYMNEFFLPHNNAENSERYYSFEWGDAKFIALDVITPYDDTTFPINSAPLEDRWWTDFRQGSPQYQFLEDELRCNDKKWSFVYFHEGPWTNYWGPDYSLPNELGGDYYQFDGNQMVRDHLVPLFEQYNVDFVLVGHSHLYEKAEKNGVMYITSGSAGDGDVSTNTEYADHPEITLSILDNVYVKYMIDNNTISFNVINKDNNIVDTYTNTKSYTMYSVTPNVNNASCANASDGSVTLNVEGPKPPYSVEWFNGTTGNVLSNVTQGTYYAVVTDANGCEKVASAVVGDDMETADATFSQTNVDNIYDFLAVETNGTSYEWNFGNGDTETTATNTVQYTYPENGTYTVSLTVTTVCGTDTYTLSLDVTDAPNSLTNIGGDKNGVFISPNPFTEEAQVSVKGMKGKLQVFIYDATGKEIQSFKTRKHTWDIYKKDFPLGIYWIKVLDKEGKGALNQIYVK